MNTDETSPESETAAAESRRLLDRRLELFAVIIMSLTAVVTAWTGFQSAKWSGVMSIRFAEANALRTDSVRFSDLASAQRAIDIDLGLNWVRAIDEGDERLAEFLYNRFPDHLQVAVDAWVATDPLDNPDAAATPFELEEYFLADTATADELNQRANERSQAARDANQRSDNYVVLTIVFALVIFFAALSTKLEHPRNRRFLLVGALALMVAGIAVLLSYPVEL